MKKFNLIPLLLTLLIAPSLSWASNENVCEEANIQQLFQFQTAKAIQETDKSLAEEKDQKKRAQYTKYSDDLKKLASLLTSDDQELKKCEHTPKFMIGQMDMPEMVTVTFKNSETEISATGLYKIDGEMMVLVNYIQ